MDTVHKLDETKRNEILEKAKVWFGKAIITKHIENIEKLNDPNEFNINPFLTPYLATFFDGGQTPESVAKALILPRALGSSITTTFGTALQKFMTSVFKDVFGSAASGIDVEFVDCIDGRKKYCQTKLGPNTINKDDVTTIVNHFTSIKNLARTNNLQVQINDLIVGVLYGEADQLSTHYRAIRDQHHHPVYAGSEFWTRLTGDETFYVELIKAISSVVSTANGKTSLDTAIAELASKQEIIDLAANKFD